MEAASPKVAAADVYPVEEHPHLRTEVAAEIAPEPLPIATSRELQMMPPSSGLPVGRGAVVEDGATLRPLLDSLPEADFSENTIHAPVGSEAARADHHG